MQGRPAAHVSMHFSQPATPVISVPPKGLEQAGVSLKGLHAHCDARSHGLGIKAAHMEGVVPADRAAPSHVFTRVP